MLKLHDVVTVVENNQVIDGRVIAIIYNKIDRIDLKTGEEVNDESTQININLKNEDGKTFSHTVIARPEEEIFQNPAQARKYMRDLFTD